MKTSRSSWIAGALLWLGALSGIAGDLDTIGVSALQAVVPGLSGAGVPVAQPEAGLPLWQVSPAAVGQPASLFTWNSDLGIATNFPNAVGQESAHAITVGNLFYGTPDGVAPGVAGVDNYEANYFLTSVVSTAGFIPARVVNQSFITGGQDNSLDLQYDRFITLHSNVVVSGVGNSGPPSSPATAFNGIGVGSATASSSVGPTSDGRCKPDLTAPGSLTSWTTPLVAGCAALLLQAAATGPDPDRAMDARTIKALLLNGADKPAGWTNAATQPLDLRYGAGSVNVLNAWRQWRGGRYAASAATAVGAGDPHPPPPGLTPIDSRRGWDLCGITNAFRQDRVHHYGFDLSSSSNRLFTLQATLVWHRQAGRQEINDLDLFLFDADTGALLAASQSPVDNVEHLFVTNLPPARFELQVLKHGVRTQSVTPEETYALAFDFGPPAPARLVGPLRVNGRFQAQLTGEPYTSYVIEVTTNFMAWTALLTNTTSAAGTFDFSDATPGTTSPCFYRAVWAP